MFTFPNRSTAFWHITQPAQLDPLVLRAVIITALRGEQFLSLGMGGHAEHNLFGYALDRQCQVAVLLAQVGLRDSSWESEKASPFPLIVKPSREDGSIVPSNGIWGLRELVKRTFVYMNELGMRPITMAPARS